MTDLALLSLQRATVVNFAGTTLADQLLAGRAAAEAALRKYVPDMKFDPAAADDLLAKIDVWQVRNEKDLAGVLADHSATRLPEAIRLSFSNATAQGFIIAGYTRAASGLGPWLSGAVAREAETGTKIQMSWAREDAMHRLLIFGSIVQMDNEGYLKTLFVEPAPGGMGNPALVVWVVAIVAVAVAALILLYVYSSRRLEVNNRLMRDLCSEAQRTGDATTVAACIEATKGLQSFAVLDSIASGLGKIALLAGALWVGFNVLPLVMEKKRKRPS